MLNQMPPHPAPGVIAPLVGRRRLGRRVILAGGAACAIQTLQLQSVLAVSHGAAPAKIGVCHATGSATNPYVYIQVDQNALKAHADHEHDIIGVESAADCPTTRPD